MVWWPLRYLREAWGPRRSIIGRSWLKLKSERVRTFLLEEDPDRDWYVTWVRRAAPASIVEIGPGSAWEARRLAGIGRLHADIAYTCVEPSPALRRWGRQVVPEADWLAGSAERLPVGDSQCQVVYARHVVMHVSDPSLMLRECCRASGGGTVILSLGWWKDDGNTEWLHNEKRNDHLISLSNLSQWFVEAGLSTPRYLVFPPRVNRPQGHVGRDGRTLIAISSPCKDWLDLAEIVRANTLE